MCIFFLFQVEVYKSYVYKSMNFQKIKNEIYIHAVNTQMKKQNITKN